MAGEAPFGKLMRLLFSSNVSKEMHPPPPTLGPMPLMNQKATYGGVSWKVPRTQLVPIKALKGSNVEDAERSPFSDMTYGSNRYKLRT